MASTVFNDITFWQDTPANRAIAVGYAGTGTPEKEWQDIFPPNDSGTTPGITYNASPSSVKGIAPSGKILMRIGAETVDSDTKRYPLVKNFRQGNTNTQGALTKVADGNNQVGYYLATNPAVDVNTIIVPAPALVPFTIQKLNFSNAMPPAGTVGVFTKYWDPSKPGGAGYVTLNPTIAFSPDAYNTYWEWDSANPGNPQDDGAPLIAGSLPTYIWFELTPSVALVGNARIRLTFNNVLEYSDLSLGQYNPPY